MSGLIPQSEIDRANDDILSVIKGYMPDLKKTGKNWSACCPFHNEKSASFTVNEAKGMYYCFGCGAGGNAVGFVMDHQGLDFPSAVRSILGEVVTAGKPFQKRQPPKAIRCDLPGSAENIERATEFMRCVDAQPQHPYFIRNNTAPLHGCFTMKSRVIIPLINNIGETVNVASMGVDGDIKYIAEKPSFGAAAILNPEGEHDGKTIMCVDYAHAWRIWWSQCGKSKVIACLDRDNFLWMLRSCQDRYTHVGCDPEEADEHVELGRAVVAMPLDPYKRLDRNQAAQ